MECEQLTCFGKFDLDCDHILPVLDTVLRQAGFEYEWVAGAKCCYASWHEYSQSGPWIYVGDPEVSREISKALAAILQHPVRWYQAQCEFIGSGSKLSYQAREISSTGKMRTVPSTSLDGKDLHRATYGKASDRIEQILSALIGLHDETTRRSHSFKLFRGSADTEVDDTPKEWTDLDANRVEMMLNELDNAIAGTLIRDSKDHYLLSVKGESGSGMNIYASCLAAYEFQARMTEDQRLKLHRPGIRPLSDPRIPQRPLSVSVIELRKLMAETVGVDRFTIDVDAPLSSIINFSRGSLIDFLHRLQGWPRFAIAVDDAIISALTAEDAWESVVHKMTLNDLARFVDQKRADQRQWSN